MVMAVVRLLLTTAVAWLCGCVIVRLRTANTAMAVCGALTGTERPDPSTSPPSPRSFSTSSNATTQQRQTLQRTCLQPHPQLLQHARWCVLSGCGRLIVQKCDAGLLLVVSADSGADLFRW
jgi:hypothetical protein